MLLPTIALAIAATAPEIRPLFTYEDYPAEALRNNWQGKVGVDLTISPEGKAVACVVIRSSRHRVLDDATCQIYMTRAKFQLKKDRAGNPTSYRLKPTPTVWSIRR